MKQFWNMKIRVFGLLLCGAMLWMFCPRIAAAEEDPSGDGDQNTPAAVVTSWTYNDPEKLTVDDTGAYTLALGVADTGNPEDYPTLNDILGILPGSVTATIEGVEETQELDLTWACSDYPQADVTEAPSQDSYTFTAALPEGYSLADGAAELTVTVCFDGGH